MLILEHCDSSIRRWGLGLLLLSLGRPSDCFD